MSGNDKESTLGDSIKTVSIERPSLPFNPINPVDNTAWMALCRDPQWNCQVPTSNSSSKDAPKYHVKGWDWKEESNDEFDPLHTPLIDVDEMDIIHAGALAPKFVFTNKVQTEPQYDDKDVYTRRLMSVLCNRFVILPRPSHGSAIEETAGMPEPGNCYWWRYWDNDDNVYQSAFQKFRDAAGTYRMVDALAKGQRISYRKLEDATERHGMPPGDFDPPDDAPMWMRVRADAAKPETEMTDCSSFFDHMWSFTYHGTTRVALWDANLIILSRLAGFPEQKKCRSCENHIERMLRRCARCKLVHYCKEGSCQRDDWLDHKKMCNCFK